LPVTVTIVRHPSGAVIATGGDDLAHRLLNHAGFERHTDVHGIRHRLRSSMGRESQQRIAARAAGMLGAAGYPVRLGVELEGTVFPLDGQLLALADAVREAGTGSALARALAPLVDEERGVLVRLQEAVEAASEQVTDLNEDAVELSDHLSAAADGLFEMTDELKDTVKAVLALTSEQSAGEERTGSPAAERAGVGPAGPTAGTATVPVTEVRGGRGR
jgi:hypothetical protein